MDRIETGDLLLFSGKDMTSRWIKTLSNSRWSHVAIAIRLKEGNKGDGDNFEVVSSGGSLYVMETIMDDWDHDFLSQKVKQDFRLVPIENRTKKEYSLISYRSLNKSLVNKKYLKKTKKFLLDHKDTKFYSSMFQLFKLWIGLDPNIKKGQKDSSNEKEYCCTTIAAKYIRVVLGIPMEENVIPSAFDHKECDRHGIILRDFYTQEINFWTNHEDWHESVGLLLAFFLIWIIFWWLTSAWFFRST